MYKLFLDRPIVRLYTPNHSTFYRGSGAKLYTATEIFLDNVITKKKNKIACLWQRFD